MEPTQLLEMAGSALVLLGLGLAVYGRFSRAGRACHAARRAPRTTIARAPTGTTVTLVGRIRLLRSTLVAPLTGRRCGYYVIAPFAAYGGHDHTATASPPVAREEDGCEFILDDGTGLATVRVDDVALMDDPGCLQPGSDAQQRAMLERRGLSASSNDWTLHEWTLGEGDLVAVSGVVQDRAGTVTSVDAATGYRARPREVVIGPSGGLPLVLRHHDDDGAST
jgi:hypothetical protein